MSAPHLADAWRKLPSERRLAAVAAILLFVSLFFPWYQETVIARGLGEQAAVGQRLDDRVGGVLVR